MSLAEQLRTFVAVYRSRSVTEGAVVRGLSQPAASQHVAGLERRLGTALFVRGAHGVEPTGAAVGLYAQTAGALDQLEAVLDGIESTPGSPGVPLRVGSSAEFFSALVLPRLVDAGLAVVATFGDDADLTVALERGDLDVAVVSAPPGRRAYEAVAVGHKTFVLVAAPPLVPATPFPTLAALGDWLADRSWVAYSLELPITRRFWQTQLGRPFSAHLSLVAPDLRAVAGAVERGLGVSILPRFVCARALAHRTVSEVHPVSALIPAETWFACYRTGSLARPDVGRFVELLGR